MPADTFRIRPLTKADAAQAATLIRAAFAEPAGSTDPPPSALGETADRLAAGTGAVAEAAGDLAAVVLWEDRDGGLYVCRLAVAPAWRRRGIARALIAEAEAEARRRAAPRMHLGTRLSLAANRALFAACGFAETRRHAHAGFDAPTWVEMEKPLEPACQHGAG